MGLACLLRRNMAVILNEKKRINKCYTSNVPLWWRKRNSKYRLFEGTKCCC